VRQLDRLGCDTGGLLGQFASVRSLKTQAGEVFCIVAS
jgi:hypothetical protein